VVFVVWMLQTQFLAPHVGLALATTASAYFNAYRLARGLRHDAILGPLETFSRPLLKILLACIAMGLVIHFMLPGLDLWTDWRWHQRVLELGWVILPAVFCYGSMLWIMGFRRQHIVG
jgi:putative peptidoglycan lipid II flippase